MRHAQPSDHLACLEHATWLFAPAIARSADLPQMLQAAQRRRSVLGANANDWLETLGIDTDNRSRMPVAPDHEISDSQFTDRLEAPGREHAGRERLRAPSHEREGCDLDHAPVDVPRDLLRV